MCNYLLVVVVVAVAVAVFALQFVGSSIGNTTAATLGVQKR